LVTFYHASASGSGNSDVRLKILEKDWFYS
jgi:hypothetical protein